MAEYKFELYGTFQSELTSTTLWEQATDRYKRYFSLMNQSNAEFITQFSKNSSLTSTGHDYAFTLPRPPQLFVQSKKTNDLDQLWDYHSEGAKFLIEEYGVRNVEIYQPVEVIINQEQIEHGK